MSSPTAYAFHRQRIVIADDDSVIIAMMIDTLRRAGHCVVLRERLPALPVLYLGNAGQSTAELEARLPRGVPILRVPFTTAELQAAVRPLLPQLRAGTILALPVVTVPSVSGDLPRPAADQWLC